MILKLDNTGQDQDYTPQSCTEQYAGNGPSRRTITAHRLFNELFRLDPSQARKAPLGISTCVRHYETYATYKINDEDPSGESLEKYTFQQIFKVVEAMESEIAVGE